MATIKKDGAFMALPMNIRRGNPIPVDDTMIWYSMEELETYAASGATSYVGQIVTLVDETNNTTAAYMISNAAGTLVKLAQTTTTGDLAGDVATLQGQVNSLIAQVGHAASSAVGTEGEEGYKPAQEATGLVKAIADINAAIGADDTDDTIKGRIADLESSVNDTLMGEATVAGSVAQAKKAGDDALEAIGADDTEGLRARIKANEDAISTLVGDTDGDDGKSARAIAAEEVAKIVANADEKYDTLKEIADWIQSDTTGAASLANKVESLEEQIGKEASTKVSHSATQEDVDAGKAENIGDEVIDTPASDATGLVADLRAAEADIDTLEADSHKHDNKALLDAYTQTETDLAEAVSKKHEHANAEELAKIESGDKAAWDAAVAALGKEAKAESAEGAGDGENATGLIADVRAIEAQLDSESHTHKNKALLDTYNQTNADLSTAVTQSHTHANATILDGISQDDIDNWDGAQAAAEATAKALIGDLGKVSEEGTLAHTVKSYVDAKDKAINDTIGTAKDGETAGTGLIGRIEALEAEDTSINNKIGAAGSEGVAGTGLTGRIESLEAAIGEGGGVSTQINNALDTVIGYHALADGEKTIDARLDVLEGTETTSGSVAEAKKAGDDAKALIGTIPAKVGDTDTTTAVAYIDAKVAAAEKAASDAIDGLDKADTAVDHQFVTAVSEENGIITVSRAALVADDIPDLTLAKITDAGTAAAADVATVAIGTADEANDALVTVAQVKAYVSNEAYDDSALKTLHADKTGEGVAAGTKMTVAEEVEAGIDELDLANTYEAKGANDDAIEALQLTHATKEDGSFKTVAEEAAAEVAKVVDEAPEAFDTLKEIAEWIGSGDVENTTAASMLTDISSLKTQVGKEAVAAQGTEGEEDYVAAKPASGLVADVRALEAAVGEGGSVSTQITNAINALDATVTNSVEEGTQPDVVVTVVETDGKLTSVTATVTAERFDSYGAASAVQGETTETVKSLADKIGVAKDGETPGTGLTGRIETIESTLASADTYVAITNDEIDALFAATPADEPTNNGTDPEPSAEG